MSTEQRSGVPGQESWKAPVSPEKRKLDTVRPPAESPDVGRPIFQMDGIKTIVPGTIPLSRQEMRGAFDSVNYDRLVFPKDDEPTIDVEPSILDHNDEIPPSPAMQKFRKLISKFRLPALLLGGLMAAKGAVSGAEAYERFEVKGAAVESALSEARDNVGGGLAEFAASHAPSQDEIVTLSDGTKMTRGEWTVTVNVANTERVFLELDIYGNSSGQNAEFAKKFSTDIPRSAMEEGYQGMREQHAELSRDLSPFFGDSLYSVADSVIRDEAPGSTNEASLKNAIEKTYGDSAGDVLAKMEASGMSLHDASDSLIQLVRVKNAEKHYQRSLSVDGSAATGYDAALMTAAYGSTLHFNDAMYEATAPGVGLDGLAEMEIYGEIMTSPGEGTIYQVESTMGGQSVSMGMGTLEGGVDSDKVKAEVVAFGSAFSAKIINALDLSNADPGMQAMVIEKVEDVLFAQMKLVEAQAGVVAAEKVLGDTSSADIAAQRLLGGESPVSALMDAQMKSDLALKILDAASGVNADVSALTKEVRDGNIAAAKAILESGNNINPLDGYWDAQIGAL